MNSETNSKLVNRRQVLRGGAAGAALIGAGGILAACGGGASTDSSSGQGQGEFSPGPETGGKAKRGGNLRVGLPSGGDAETIDPRKAISNPDIARCYALYDQLFTSVPGGKYAPSLAESASASPDSKTWTLHLRRGVEWHDGRPFNADDVVYTIKASWGSETNTLFAGFVKTAVDYKATRKVDDYTVEVKLLKGLAEFPQICAQWPLSILQNGTTDFGKGVGTGPFVLKSFTPGSESVFSANPNYWKSGLPYVDELTIISTYSSVNTQLNALLAGDIDISPQVSQPLARANRDQVVLGNQPAPGFIAPTMHITDKPFDDVRVRQALRLLANREEAVQVGLDGFGTPGNDCAGQTLEYWAADFKREADPEEAMSLLKQAGQEDLNLTLYTADLVGGVNALAVMYAQQAKQGGVTINVHTDDAATYYSAGSPGGTYPNKSFSMNQWAFGMPCLSAVYLSADIQGSIYNETAWGNPKADALLFEAMAEGNPGRAKEKWHAVQELQYNEGGYIIMGNITFTDAYDDAVRGVKTTSAGPCNNYDFAGAWLET
jgi:peptide/nickel transport system substrate-binding protein